MRFWDTSALVPIIIDERASRRARALWTPRKAGFVWWSSIVECVGAISRAEREGVLTPAAATNALVALNRLRDDWQEVEPSDRVRDLAQRFLRVHPLRAADALQLAAAYVAADGVPRSVEFICLDSRLRSAAEREGFAVADL